MNFKLRLSIIALICIIIPTSISFLVSLVPNAKTSYTIVLDSGEELAVTSRFLSAKYFSKKVTCVDEVLYFTHYDLTPVFNKESRVRTCKLITNR